MSAIAPSWAIHVRSDSNKEACFLFPGRAFIEGHADAPKAVATNEGDAEEIVTAKSLPGEEIVTQAEMEEAWARAREMEVSLGTTESVRMCIVCVTCLRKISPSREGVSQNISIDPFEVVGSS